MFFSDSIFFAMRDWPAKKFDVEYARSILQQYDIDRCSHGGVDLWLPRAPARETPKSLRESESARARAVPAAAPLGLRLAKREMTQAAGAAEGSTCVELEGAVVSASNIRHMYTYMLHSRPQTSDVSAVSMLPICTETVLWDVYAEATAQ